MRKVFCVLSSRSLPYAQYCLASLLRNAAEPIDLLLITDGPSDVTELQAALAGMALEGHRAHVVSKAEADERAATAYAAYPAIAQFREGHPCWRKVTDPPLFAAPGEEVVIIDPDVYFPNRFTFEATPPTGLLLMWQRPNCLLPETVVDRAYDQGVAMADHTDIGVCQYRAPLDLPFLDRLVTSLGGPALPRSMHVESIVWAALAERMGGGHLDPVAWRCFDNSVAGRVRRKLGRSGVTTLRALDFGVMKAFHAGGVAKYWLPEAERSGLLEPRATLDQPSATAAYAPYPRAKFKRKLAVRGAARALGVYRLLASE